MIVQFFERKLQAANVKEKKEEENVLQPLLTKESGLALV